MHSCSKHSKCVESAIKKAEQVCEERHQKLTKVRKKVLELIWKSHKPSKAYDVLNKIDKRIASIKPPTVYRALDFLMENGLVHKLSSLNAYIGCSHPLKHKHCYFLLCVKCKEIQECCSEELSKFIEYTSLKNKFDMKNVTVEIEGICNECG